MPKTVKQGRKWGQCAWAVLLSVLFLAIVLPNTGKVVVDHNTTPITLHIVNRVRDSLLLITLVLVPLALIVIGTVQRSKLVIPGWVLLMVLVVVGLMK